MARFVDPITRARTYAARRAGMQDAQKMNRRVRNIENVLTPLSGGDGGVSFADDWTPVQVVTVLPEPTEEVVGRLFVLQSDETQDTINIGLTSADGTPILVGLNVLGSDSDEFVLQFFFGVPGAGDGEFSTPNGVAVDSAGNIYVADSDNHRIQKFDSDGVFVSQFGSFGTGNGQFNFPAAIAIDGADNIYVADLLNHRVQKFNSSAVYQLQFGTAGAGNGQFNRPDGVAIDSLGNIYVADSLNHRVQKFNSSGVYQSQFGASGAGNGQFNRPAGVAIDDLGNIYVADSGNHRVQKFTSAHAFTLAFGTNGNGDGQFVTPFGIAIHPESDAIVVADSGNGRIQFFDADGAFSGRVGSSGTGSGQLSFPVGLAVTDDGVIYITEVGNNRVSVLDVSQPGITVGESGVIKGRVTALDFDGGFFDVTVTGDEANVSMPGVVATITQRSNSISVANNAFGSISVQCIAGEVVTGGGFLISNTGVTNVEIQQSARTGNGWIAQARNVSGSAQTLTAYAMCLAIT